MEYTKIDSNNGSFVTVYDLDDCLKAIKVRNDDNERRIKSLEEENRRLQDVHYKDEELQKMKLELEAMREKNHYGFPITKEEHKAIENWKKEHAAKAHGLKNLEDRLRSCGAIGEKYTYWFVPTSIGVIGTVKCSCGESFTFQDLY